MTLRDSDLPRSRWAAAASLATTAAIHTALVPAHLREAPYAGALFIALSAAALTLAFLLVVRDDQFTWLGAGGLSASALLAYAASRSVGLPSLGDDIGDWLNPLGVVAAVSEITTVLICWQVLPRSRTALERAHLSVS
jgi:hypothetical protein